MRLFEAIVDANHRAVAGDPNAAVRVVDFENELPVIALTCVDPRLNALFPSALGLPGEEFIWLRNAGNIITGPLSSTMRSLALACAVKGGKEIAIIGHTDCQVGKTTTMQLLEKFDAMGVKRDLLPANINEFFGMFGSERQNVIKSCEFARHSPLIGPKVPVHGFLVDVVTGKLDWLVNGYENWETMANRSNEAVKTAAEPTDMIKSLADFQIGEMKFPETKIGEIAAKAEEWLKREMAQMGAKATPPVPPVVPPPAQPPKLPLPPRIQPRMHVRRGGK
jgi:carbonic anhydrase